ncbi:MAG: uroporphyrinogen-III synthase [Flavobacteriales bacterium]
MKVKSILISQPQPKTDTSPYFKLERKNIKIDFVPFIHVEGVKAREVRKQKIDFTKFTAIILTSRNAVDNFFRLAEEMRYKVPDALKYYCQSEAIAKYLQNYIVYRKRKIYVGEKTFVDLIPIIKKHKGEKFMLPSSNVLSPIVTKSLNELTVDWKRAIMYKTVSSDLSNLENVYYDILVFFSPSGIKSLLENFPNFKQKDTRIAVFGKSTVDAAEDAGLKVDIQVPAPGIPSMSMALENYVKTQE